MTKYFVSEYMYLNQSKELIGKFIRFTYVLNPGAAFGISVGNKNLFLAISIIAVVVIFLYYRHLHTRGNAIGLFLGCILGGALGNLIDRIRLGKVVDFIDIGPWPIFNIADIAVTVGVFGLVFLILKEEQDNKRKEAEENEGETDPSSDESETESLRTLL